MDSFIIKPSRSIDENKQIIISHLDKKEKGTNLAQEYGISKHQISDIRKNKDKILKSTDSIDTSEGSKGIINIHIFDYLDSRLSGLFTEVPTSSDNRDSTVLTFPCASVNSQQCKERATAIQLISLSGTFRWLQTL